MKFHTKKEYKERVRKAERDIERRKGSEIYGAKDKAVDDAHSRMVNSNGY